MQMVLVSNILCDQGHPAAGYYILLIGHLIYKPPGEIAKCIDTPVP